MATKKITTKKKITTVKRGKPFNLNIRTPEQAETLIAYLNQLKTSGGWTLMVQILEGNMAVLEKTIITRIDPETGTRLGEAQLDELRSKHAVFGELVGKPDQLIAAFRKQSSSVVPDYDPYHVSIKKMLNEDKDDVRESSPGTLTT